MGTELVCEMGPCIAEKHMKLYLDDEREAPEGWVRVRWPEEAIELLKTGHVTEVSLDHDLGDDEHGSGYDVVLWIEEAVARGGFVPPRIEVHSANPPARAKMDAGWRESGGLWTGGGRAGFNHEKHETHERGGKWGGKRATMNGANETNGAGTGGGGAAQPG